MSPVESLDPIQEVIVSPNSEFLLFARANGRTTLGAVTQIFNEKKLIRLTQTFDKQNIAACIEKSQQIIRGLQGTEELQGTA